MDVMHAFRPLVLPVLMVIIAMFITGFTLINAQTWSEPAGEPPAGNTPAPINVGPETQNKQGNLAANIFAAFTEMRSDRYCNAVGENCSDPLPQCEVGQLITAGPNGTWNCTNFPAPTITVRFNTKFVGLVNDPAFRAWLGPQGDGVGDDDIPDPHWRNDHGWYSRSADLGNRRWTRTIDKLCSFMMVDGRAAIDQMGYSRREDYGSDNNNIAWYWSASENRWLTEHHGDDLNIDITELVCAGTAVTEAGERWRSSNLSYPGGDVRYNPFWSNTRPRVWIN